MQEYELQRLMRLSHRTGTPLIVSREEESFVLMGIDAYEELLGADAFDFNDLPSEFFSEEDSREPAMSMYDASQGDQPPSNNENGEHDLADINSSMQHRAAPIVVDESTDQPNVSSAVPGNMSHEEEERFYLEPID